jgi:hypothetical protein
MPHSVERLGDIEEDSWTELFFLKSGRYVIGYSVYLVDVVMFSTETELSYWQYVIFVDNGCNTF